MKHLALLLLGLTACAAPDRSGELRRVAGEYAAYGKVDDLRRWAPERCDMPPPPQPRVSAAGASTPHGRKLYHLYAKDRAAYLKGGEQPEGQAIVKEAWLPGKTAKEGLYVMMKTGAEDSDAGWIYGTMTPDGTVTSIGRVASCMSCHEAAPKDRIFGLQR